MHLNSGRGRHKIRVSCFFSVSVPFQTSSGGTRNLQVWEGQTAACIAATPHACLQFRSHSQVAQRASKRCVRSRCKSISTSYCPSSCRGNPLSLLAAVVMYTFDSVFVLLVGSRHLVSLRSRPCAVRVLSSPCLLPRVLRRVHLRRRPERRWTSFSSCWSNKSLSLRLS